MASITYDGRSLLIDGKRIWLVSGSIQYTRVPREYWADRIHAAKLAGLNCVDTSVVWARHESRPGHFDFKGDNDLKHFIDLVGKAGMYASLRIGPHVGAGFDMGGMPAWLVANKSAEAKAAEAKVAEGKLPVKPDGDDNAETRAIKAKVMRLRAPSQPFLEAASRFINAVSAQVRGLQVTATAKGGPLVLIHNEANWTCGDQTVADAYLGEVLRYIRESGFDVPIVNSNNLWAGVEGEIDGWSGSDEMLSAMRQFAMVRSLQPRFVVDFETAKPDAWGVDQPSPTPAWLLQRQIAEVLAGAGQYNLSPFHAGTQFGTSAGRLDNAPDHFGATAVASHAPLTETGSPNESFSFLKRLNTFATRFARVLSGFDPTFHPVMVAPRLALTHTKKGKHDPHEPPATVVHASGSQGGVAFVFTPGPADKGEVRTVELMMHDGTVLPVHMTNQSVAWCLINASVGGRANVDYCTLCALGAVGRTLVIFGPAGLHGTISINGSPLELRVPDAKERRPEVIEHENMFVVVLSEELADATYFADDAVYVNAAGLTTDGRPLPIPGEKQITRVDGEGDVRTVDVAKLSTNKKPEKAPEKIALANWACAPLNEYVSGESARYAAIDGPADLATLGTSTSYGWYRIQMKPSKSERVVIAAPGSADRLHFFDRGREVGLLGVGPGSHSTVGLSLHKPEQTLVVLGEALGRYSDGRHMGETKGLVSHLLEVSPIKTAAPKAELGAPIDILRYINPVFGVRQSDATLPERITWHLGKRSGDIVMVNKGVSFGALLVVNDKPIGVIDVSGPSTILIDHEKLGRGNVTIQLALFPLDGEEESVAAGLIDSAAHAIEFHTVDSVVTEKSQWSFAKFDVPTAAAFKAGAKHEEGPCWWKTTFTTPVTGVPMFLELDGLTKGQLYLNGKHLGRYFMATKPGKDVGPQRRYWVPGSWLKHEGLKHEGAHKADKKGEAKQPPQNELMIFDEHGAKPTRVKLVFDDTVMPITTGVTPEGV
jgi:hypothetical protein